ncbi:MAG: HRDC domain-containing protein, partial [Acidimicrobiia bacterium]
SESVTVIARARAASPFVGQLHTAAPEPEPEKVAVGMIAATEGLEIVWQGFSARVVAVEQESAVVSVGAASRMRVPWGETVTVANRRVRLAAPAEPAVDERALDRLKEWRRQRAAADGVPPYVIAHDAHLASIAARGPTTLEDLSRCEGIGPARLERYGDDILEVVAESR